MPARPDEMPLVFRVGRQHPNKVFSVQQVVSPDGTVFHSLAFLVATLKQSTCSLANESYGYERFSLDAKGDDGGSKLKSGFVGGKFSDSPAVVVAESIQKEEDGFPHHYLSDAWIYRLSNHDLFVLAPEDGKQKHQAYDHLKYGAPFSGSSVVPFRDGVFFNVGGLHQQETLYWSVATGTRTLLKLAPEKKLAWGFGTDGVNMVWSQALSPTAGSEEATEVEVWTAPYSVEPDVLNATKRRVGKDWTSLDYHMWKTNCGWAARLEYDPLDVGSAPVRLVRLSDGRRFAIRGKASANFWWEDILGITCDEIFLHGHDPLHQVARFRFDALGDGDPADLVGCRSIFSQHSPTSALSPPSRPGSSRHLQHRLGARLSPAHAGPGDDRREARHNDRARAPGKWESCWLLGRCRDRRVALLDDRFQRRMRACAA